MSNEKNAQRIKSGDTSAIPLLWEGVKRFVRLWAGIVNICAVFKPTKLCSFS